MIGSLWQSGSSCKIACKPLGVLLAAEVLEMIFNGLRSEMSLSYLVDYGQRKIADDNRQNHIEVLLY